MSTIQIKTVSGKPADIAEMEFYRAIIAHLRQTSPDRIKILSEEINTENGIPDVVPTVIMFLVKNPEHVVGYQDVVTPENYHEK